MANLLLMDDDLEFAFEFRGELEKQGHEITWVRSASEAFETLNQNDIDIIITDIYIYRDGKVVEDGGISLISDIRISRFKSDQKDLTMIPIIAISGAPNNLGNQFILDTAETIGAHYSMVKPLDYRILGLLIRTIIAKEPS